jgi:Ca2+-binding RTX toxin-like protein
MAVWNVSPFKFNIIGNDTLLSPWREVTGPGERINNHWNIAALPNYQVQQVAFVDMGLHNVNANAINEDRLTLAENGTFVLNIRGVEHIDAPANKTVNLEVVGKTGFTTDGSLNTIETNVGNHVIFYTGATRDSTLFTGTGWDQVRLIDHPGVGGTQYWSLVRRADGQIDAYSLHSGYQVRIEGGGTTWGNTNGRLNYGEVDEIYAASRNRPDGDVFQPGTNVSSTGDRGSFDNIDLSNAALNGYTDRFIAASFKSVHYATQNVHVGTAIIETFNGDTTGGTQSASRDHITTNGNQHLLVNEETVAIDGHLRLYVRDNNSGLYNRFNEVYLGTSAAEVNTNNYSTTSQNAYATNQGTGQGATPVLGTAMYGFGGNDVLTGSTDVDYLFGGASTFTTITGSALPGNSLTGGNGGDYFGVGNINAGLDDDAIMTTDFTTRLSGTAPQSTDPSGVLSRLSLDGATVIRTADTADLVTRVATDRITDWTAGIDFLRVLGNGTVIIEGLGTANGSGAGGYVVDQIGSDAERIDLSGSQVVNNGKIVARGLGGVDTIVGSTGNDWLYGNAASNYYNISQAGNDRIYIDQFDGSRSKHFVEGFTIASTPANADLVMLNKRVIDSFFAGGSGRTALSLDVNADYVQAQAYNGGVNFLHDPFYNPTIASPNSVHIAQDGRGLLSGATTEVPTISGSDGTSSYIGLGMAVAGYAMFAIPFVGPIIGSAMIATGALLGGVGGVVQTTPHLNATYSGNVGGYLNVLTDAVNAGNGIMLSPNTTVGNDDLGVRFLDFFQNNNANDGYIPVVEFTAHSGQGIYGYFALHSDDETFVFLVASRDNLVENGEAIMVSQINGRLTAADFGIYDGEFDIYNYGVLPAVVLRDPTITTIADSQGTPDQGQTDGRIENATNPIVITGNVTAALSTGSYFRVYDGSTKIYDGAAAVGLPVTLSLNGTGFVFTDSRSLGTTARNTTNSAPTGGNTTGNDTFVLTNAIALYTVELVDGETGIPTRISSRDITISGGNATVNGGDGTDILMVTETSSFLNTLPDNRLLGMDSIVLTGTVDSATNLQIPISLNLSNQLEGFQIVSGSAGDTIIASQGNDTINGLGGADSINAGIGDDVVVYSTEFVLVNNQPTNAVDRTSAQQLLTDATVIGGDGFDTLRFDTDLRDAQNVLQASPAVVLADTDFAKVTQFEAIALNGTGTQTVTIAGNANSAFATGITVTTEPTATSLNFNASNAGWTRNATVTGTNNADTIVGGSGNDAINGGNGNDTITGGAGTDNLVGGAGIDTFIVSAVADFAVGETVTGGNDTDTLRLDDAGTYGNTVLSATVTGIENITLNENAAGFDLTLADGTYVDAINNTITVSSAVAMTNGVRVNAGTTTGTHELVVTGTNLGGNDTLIGGAGSDTLGGGNGNDTITGGGGGDSLTGGSGTDLFIVSNVADFAAGETVTGGDDTDTLRLDNAGTYGNTVLSATVTGVENITLNQNAAGFDLTLADGTYVDATNNTVTISSAVAMTNGIRVTGGATTNTHELVVTGTNLGGNDTLTGGAGNDSIEGGAGNDTIMGGTGADSLVGGDEDDTFRFSSGDELAADTTVIGGNNSDTIAITAADLTIVDADFTNVSTVETLSLTGASTVVLGTEASQAGITTVRTGSGSTSITRSDATATTVDATSLSNDTVLTINDATTANFAVTNLAGDINASGLAGTLTIGLLNNTSDNDIAIVVSDQNTTISGGAAGDTLNITQMDDPQNTGIQVIDLSANASNVVITVGGERQTIKAGTGIYTIDTGAGSAAGQDRVEFVVAGSAAAPADLSGNDAALIAQISTINNYNADAIDFIGTDTVAANLTIGGFTTDINGVVTNYGGAVADLGDKIAAVRAAMDTWNGLLGNDNNRIVIFTHQEAGTTRTDTYAYGSGSIAAGNDQIVRIADDALNQITTGSSFVLDVAPPTGALTTAASLLPSSQTWYSGSTTIGYTSFSPGNDGNGATNAGDFINGTTNQLIRNAAGNFGAQQGGGDDYFTTINVPNGLWSTGLNMFGTVYTSLHMGSNGYVTFGTGFRGYVPSGIDTYTRSPMLAAQFDDLYTNAGNRNVTDGAGPSGTSTGTHQMFYYEEGNKLVFTWDNVGLYSNGVSDAQTSAGGVGSAFQIILHKPNGDAAAVQNFGIEYRYEEVSLQYASATAGWTAGDRVNFSLLNPSKTNLHQTAFNSNVGINGVWAWEVTGGEITASTFLPDVGLTAAKDTNSVTVRGFTATGYTLGGEAGDQFDVRLGTGANTGIVSTKANATFNLWKDKYVDGVATYTVTPTNGGANGAVETVDLQIVRNTDNDGRNDGVDLAVRSAGSATITVAAGGSLVDASDNDLGQTIGAFDRITTITATGVNSTINISNQSENYTLNGNTGVDNITGGSGSDTITGDGGADSLLGGAGTGNDIFIISAAAHHTAGETITGGGHTTGDQIRFTSTSGGTLTLLATVTEIEEARISDVTGNTTGNTHESINASAVVGSIALTGNDGNNSLTGNASSNTIIGGDGDDTLIGGDASDTYVVTTSGDADRITEAVNGGGADVLYTNGTGLDLSNMLVNGVATLNGAGGQDEGIEIIMIGAEQTATFAANQLAGTSLTINEDANNGNTTLNITGASGTQSFAGLVFTTAAGGNAFDDGGDRVVINVAGAGTNVITGTSIGDVIIAGTQTGTLSINGGGGTDNFQATADLTLTGWTSVENLTLVNNGTDVTISATLLNTANLQTVTGNTTGDNNAVERLIVNGTNGNDTISVASVTAVTSAMIVIDGGAGNDSITGSLAADSIVGGDGDDTLIGGSGKDTLNGGEGSDVYTFGSNNDTTVTNVIGEMDVIENFNIIDDSLNLSSLNPVSGLLATVDPSDADSYSVNWTSNGITNYVYLKDTGITGGLNLTNTAGVVTATATTQPASLGITLVSVLSDGITTQGDGPHRGYFTKGDLAPIRNTSTTYHTQSSNIGASTDYTFTLADMSAGSGAVVRDGLIAIQSTNSGVNTFLGARVYVGGATATADTISVNLTTTAGRETTFGIVYGNGGDDSIVGSVGNDYLFGGADNDTLTGGAGADTLTGGTGSDIFDYSIVSDWSATERITDFGTTSVNNTVLNNAPISINGDILRFDLSNLAAMTGYAALTTTAPTGTNGSTLIAGDFVGGAGVTTATSASAQFIFNSTTRTLYFDADGTGVEAPIVVVGDITYTGLTSGMILLVA